MAALGRLRKHLLPKDWRWPPSDRVRERMQMAGAESRAGNNEQHPAQTGPNSSSEKSISICLEIETQENPCLDSALGNGMNEWVFLSTLEWRCSGFVLLSTGTM